MRIFAISILLNLCCLELVNSQTYVQPIIGYGLSKTSSNKNDRFGDSHVISDDHLNNGFVFYGLSVTQAIFKRTSLQLQYKRSRKTVNYFDRGFVGYTNYRFGQHAVSLLPKVRLFRDFELGVGFNYNNINTVRFGFENSDRWSDVNKYYNQDQTGWVIMINYKFESFSLNLEYLDNKSVSLKRHSEINQVQSIELSIGYDFKVFNKSNRVNKKTNCPKF